MRRKSAGWLTMAAVVLAWAGAATAQSQAGQSSTSAAQEAPPLEPVAMDTLKRMSDLLKGPKGLSVRYRTAHEQMGQTGHMVDLLHLANAAIALLNKLRFEVTDDVRNTILTYDGKVVTLLDPTQRFFTQLEAP